MNRILSTLTILITAAALVLAGCVGEESPKATAKVVTPVLSGASESTPTGEPTIPAAETAQMELTSNDVLTSGSPLCQAELESNPFVLACGQEGLTVTQSENRRNLDVILYREYPLDAEQVQIDAITTSTAAEDVKSDQNEYGFFIADADGNYRVLRVQGQYFNFEKWRIDAAPEIEGQLDATFSPFIQPAGTENRWQLVCTDAACDISANGELIGRAQSGAAGNIRSIGIFTASALNEKFGEVVFSQMAFSQDGEATGQTQAYSLEDDLTSERGIFGQSGMSGTFNAYTADGFQFSPVIPYGYYSAKAGIALQDIEVSVKVKMDIQPGQPGSQYAGVVCRASQAGMYMAVLRVDGTYSVFRDTSGKPPFAVLAESSSDAILPGLVENELRLLCEGNNISFYINGEQVEALTDSRYQLNYGRAGIYTKAGGEPQADAIVFSDLEIKELE